jgi:hypothetical protein
MYLVLEYDDPGSVAAHTVSILIQFDARPLPALHNGYHNLQHKKHKWGCTEKLAFAFARKLFGNK